MTKHCEFARVPTRISGYARITASLKDAPRFSTAMHSAGPAASLEGARLPSAVIRFLVGLDNKLDMLLSQQSLAIVERDYPLRIDIREISGDGIRFLPAEGIKHGTLLEVVMLLRQAPVRLAVAKGAVTINYGDDGPIDCCMPFTLIRDTDREALVSFSFEEEREQIRQHNKVR